MAKTITSLSNRVVRDLAWVIASPPLVSGVFTETHWWSYDDCQKEFEDCIPALKKLDNNPKPLINHLNQLNSGRLGLRFEAFVAYWLMISPNYELLSQNIQIIEDGHTYGEIDFIVKDLNRDKIIHLEVAVKFYLGSSPLEDPFRWFGTNTKDQLGNKLQHLQQHQTQLGFNFTEFINYKIDERHCFLKGRLFYPQDHNTAPSKVSKNHLRGLWLGAEEKYSHQDLLEINKRDWFAEFDHSDIYQTSILKEFVSSKYAKCYIELNKAGNGLLSEKQRIFILPAGFRFPA